MQSYKLFKDFDQSREANTRNKVYFPSENKTRVLLLTGIFGLFLDIVLTKYYFIINQENSGTNIFNFYRGCSYMLLSTLHINLEKINIDSEENFQKKNFYYIILRSFLENGMYLMTILAVSKLNLIAYANLFCFFIILKMICANYWLNKKINKNDIILIAISFMIILFSSINGNKLIGAFYFCFFIAFYTLVRKVDLKIEIYTNIYLNHIATGLNSIIFTPLMVTFSQEKTSLSLLSLLIIVLISFISFYTEYTFRLAFNKIRSEPEIFNPESNSICSTTYLFSHLFFSMLIVISFVFCFFMHYWIADFYDITCGIGILGVYFYKYSNRETS
jgi:hypothetical protein